MAIAAGVLAIIGTAIAARAQERAGEVQEALSRAQAEVLRQRANEERELAAIEERRVRREGARSEGALRARLAASGIDPGQGTGLLLQTDIGGENEFGAVLTRARGRIAATRLEQQATIELFQGREARKQAKFQAAATALRGTAGAITSFGK